jgi:hypothetical protein
MPNQNDPNQKNKITETVPASVPPTDLPPIPDFMVQNNQGQTVSIQQDADKNFNPLSQPPMVTTPGKKYGGKRIIATILGILLLVGGVGAGIVLTQQPQIFKQKAEVVTTYSCANDSNCANGYKCEGGICVGNSDTSSCGRNEDPDAPVCCTNPTCEGEIVCEPPNRKECKSSGGGGTYWCMIGPSWDCVSPGGPTATPGPGGPNPTQTPAASRASCSNVKTYNSSWSLLGSTDLSNLKAGASVNFCATGTATSGSFDKAKFTINGVAQSETTVKRPGSSDFCQSYVIPSGTANFAVTAQIHHATLGWK